MQAAAPAQRGGRGRRRSAVVAAVLVLSAAVGGVALAALPASGGDVASPVCEPRAAAVPQGPATYVGARPAPGAEDRITEITLHSPALDGETRINVLLPPEYSPEQRYPVLYLLHGAAGGPRDWQTLGAVQRVVDEATAAHDLPPFLVVMPDAGAFGFYSDWYGLDVDGHNGTGSPPAWTTYHVRELIPWVDANLPTLSGRGSRAVAGLSMGGFGTMSYAARFPELFTAAGSFSGALNPSFSYPAGNAFITGASAPFNGRGLDQCIWGDFATQQARWLGHDPTYLASNLRDAGLDLYVASGGGYVERPEGFVTDPVEQTCYVMSRAFTDQLDAHDVPHVADFYATGGHDWAWWQRKLGEFLPLMAESFARPAPSAPEAFSYRSIERAFSAWDWSFTVERDVTEFAYLTDVGRHGLSAVGSGLLQVQTAALYTPGAVYSVAQAGTAHDSDVVADGTGRLTFRVDLGPSHTVQQARFDELATSGWARAHVTIAAADVTGG